MITENQLEQLAIQRFQDTGWNYIHGVVTAPERENIRAVVWTRNQRNEAG